MKNCPDALKKISKFIKFFFWSSKFTTIKFSVLILFINFISPNKNTKIDIIWQLFFLKLSILFSEENSYKEIFLSLIFLNLKLSHKKFYYNLRVYNC